MRIRFVKDMNIPISVFEDPYWDRMLSNIPGASELWKGFMEGLTRDYGGNSELFLTDYYEVREKAIQFIKDDPEWKKFNESLNLDKWKIKELKPVYKDNIYNQNNAYKLFISIDLRKANYQALKCVLGWTGCYEEWLRQFTKDKPEILQWYAENSKYLRQVIFGNCNPKRQIHVEKYIMSLLYDFINPTAFPDVFGDLMTFGADELVWRIPIDMLDVKEEHKVLETIDGVCKSLEDEIRKNRGFDTRITAFKLNPILFKTPSSKVISVYQKEYPKGKVEYKGIPKPMAPQIYRLLYLKDIDPELDTVFMSDGELVRYVGTMERLTM